MKRDNRGGKRENAGRKSIWNNKDTITIRVPRLIAAQVLELAHRLDSGENIELDTKSKSSENNFVIQSKNTGNERVTNSKIDKHEIITKSLPSYSQAIEIAKKILKQKKSARISIAQIISKLYEQTLSPEDLKS